MHTHTRSLAAQSFLGKDVEIFDPNKYQAYLHLNCWGLSGIHFFIDIIIKWWWWRRRLRCRRRRQREKKCLNSFVHGAKWVACCVFFLLSGHHMQWPNILMLYKHGHHLMDSMIFKIVLLLLLYDPISY